ncbi:MAG: DEAD/DEAH box helicase [Candidatus Margulisiibacteriota bacterium]
MPTLDDYLNQQKIKLLPYQKDAINEYDVGKHGIIEAPTGRGKTMAMALAIIHHALKNDQRPKVLWVTPMRALARDTSYQLKGIFNSFFNDISVLLRTSDTSSYQKKKARDNAWDVLITTPESCALFTTYRDMASGLADIDVVVVDEWHVLMNQKRGILFELFLSWLSDFNAMFRRWGVSATISSIESAGHILAPGQSVSFVRDNYKKQIHGDVLLPDKDTPTFRHLGRQLLPQIIQKIKSVKSTIIFTNTRSQSEQWFKLLKESHAFLSHELAIHHSAVSAQRRLDAEVGVKTGVIRCIVATSSLDLGVDLEPVDLVIHIGSPKGMARLKQRAGRSGHSPFDASEILMVPRHGFEVIESVAAISNVMSAVEDDVSVLGMPMDVLMQHIINCCMGARYRKAHLLAMCHATATYEKLSESDLTWMLDFCCNEHTILRAYPEHVKLIRDGDNYSTNTAPLIQKSQRFGVGAITSDDFLYVKFTNQKRLGTIEEQFIRQLEPQDTFLFAGQVLSVIRIQDDTVFVKKSKQRLPKFTRWYGGFMSYSSQLANYLLETMAGYHQNKRLAFPLAQQFLDWQHQVSLVPSPSQCLIELVTIDDCLTLFIYPFCGRAANQALAMSLTHAISREFKCLTAMSVNDYGFMIQLDRDVDILSFDFKSFMALDSIRELSYASFNHNEMVIQEFRQICMVSGLIYKGMPGRLKSGRYTQSSVRILYDIFKTHDPDNLLLKQARDVVFHSQLFPQRLQDRLLAIRQEIIIKQPSELTPFGFTLYQEQLSAKMDGYGY